MSEQRKFKIAIIPGDGIGTEVIQEGQRVLEHIAELSGGKLSFEFDSFPWGCEYYMKHGRMMAADGLEQLKGYDAIYFGAVGWKDVPDHISLWGLRLAITQGFDQWANIRPVRFLPGVESKLNHPNVQSLDWILIRENSEGEYAGFGGRNFNGRGPGKEVAVQSSVFTEEGCQRIIRYAFEIARTRKRKKVTSATKSNAQQYGMVLWDEVFARVSKEYPDVETEQWLVDAMAARFVLKPETLEVVVGSNLIADILSDLGSALAGSLGIAASANLNPEGRFPSMFEPVHGSAPDIAGQGIANPIGTIASGALMLKHFGLLKEAELVERAIEETTRQGNLTIDLGGTCNTREITDAILANLDKLVAKVHG
ncbi:tartrate dehydrogenase [Paenibacillus sp. GP183]|uniref:tartrate dehydrogenase n=1 Tax=Paenibacillus sp. GP183 TaxID=1882751 RepID=UPI000899D5EE|nr:tartrate dehydrogenase [Paenibacillus sp. GP183]SEC16217.1 tartrate dehydrogenase/decarboxylase / D-malate dehydrogenase [Paenibacillus sp. GP183]